MRAPVRVLAALAVGALALSGCGFKGAYSLPLPGGAAHGKTYHVTAIFPDVQDLTVQAAVRVNDVAVGDVTSITLGENKSAPGYLQAQVGMSINESVHLPANAVATLEQTTLLGEKFVALAPPSSGATGVLANDAVISTGSSSELPSVEEVFGLLSQVLNGGDLADLQTINVEISKALTGRETAVRGALTQLDRFVTGLASQKQQIVRALDNLDRFSAALVKQDSTIATALTELGPGLRVLADERAQFTALLSDLSNFGKVATHVINASKADTITGLRDLQPILGHLAAAGSDLPRALEILVTFPFPRDSSQSSPGDYTNFSADLDLTPVLCAAFANLSLAQRTPIIAQSLGLLTSLLGPSLVHTLGLGKDCPAADASAITAPPASPGSSSSSTPPAKGSGGGGSPTPGSPSSPTPTTSSSSTPPPSGLGGLLLGLGGGRNP
ncbi:MAG TPA: MCE family protein [Mycobacteriales bacterium]|nr:MCE family protein [Mycobacteriales bacterium]